MVLKSPHRQRVFPVTVSFILLGVALWVYAFRDFLNAHFLLVDDAMAYSGHTQYYLNNITTSLFTSVESCWYIDYIFILIKVVIYFYLTQNCKIYNFILFLFEIILFIDSFKKSVKLIRPWL